MKTAGVERKSAEKIYFKTFALNVSRDRRSRTETIKPRRRHAKDGQSHMKR